MQQHAAAVAMAQQQQQQQQQLQQQQQQQQAQGAYAQYKNRNAVPLPYSIQYSVFSNCSSTVTVSPSGPYNYGPQPNQPIYHYGTAAQQTVAGAGQYGRAYAQPQYSHQQYAPAAGTRVAMWGNMQGPEVQYPPSAYPPSAHTASPHLASAPQHSASSSQAAPFRSTAPHQ